MKLVYAALLLHSLGKEVDEAGVKKVMEAAGASVEAAEIKALVANLKEVNIEDAIKGASIMQAAAPAAAESKGEKKEEKAEEKEEEKAEEAAAGLGALFG